DCRGVDEAIDRGGDRRPIVWRQLDSHTPEARGDLLILPHVERAVGALDVVAACPHQAGARIHARARDAREVIAHRDPPITGSTDALRDLFGDGSFLRAADLAE